MTYRIASDLKTGDTFQSQSGTCTVLSVEDHPSIPNLLRITSLRSDGRETVGCVPAHGQVPVAY